MCTRFDSEVNSHTSTRKLVTTLILSKSDEAMASSASVVATAMEIRSGQIWLICSIITSVYPMMHSV